MPDFGAYQNEIYLAGLSGRLPSFPMRFDELEAKAHAAMPASLVSYVAGGCGDERTQEALAEAKRPPWWRWLRFAD
jgi:lactate 2-monooxygenase